MTVDITRIVTIYWPEDPDRGMEAYGPFDSVEAQSKFVDECQEAAARGWNLLDGASYLIHRVAAPFDPTRLATSEARNYGAPQEGDVVEYQGSRYMVREIRDSRHAVSEARLSAGRTDAGFWVGIGDHLTVLHREEPKP